MSLLANGLLPASFRGAPFAVEQDETGGGRRIALHTYPGRDVPWAEDMGRAPRVFRFRGFIVDGDVVFLGGPIQLQRLLLLAALEKAGPGTLTHPSLGVLNVSVRNFSMGQDLGAGRMSRVDVEFVESGKKSFPSLLSSGSGLLSAATLSKVALAVDLVRAAVLASGALGQNSDSAATSAVLADQISAAATDATSLIKLTAFLPGDNGRYAAGANSGYLASNSYAGSTDIASLIADASARRVAVGAAAAAVQSAIETVGETTTYSDIAGAISALVDALLAACADPADAIRLLTGLLAFDPTISEAQSATGGAIVTAFRRAVGTALAKAGGLYQPSSYEDAFNILTTISATLDDLATAAADNGDDASFNALRALRVQSVQDLRARGAQLARVRIFAVAMPSPALHLAQRFYGDAARADQLIAETKAQHPLFLPTTMTALAA
ncbi:prophage DNA circulation protein [Sphingomonas vulcanisoli]|uniref:Prophage DNA circulation protein n=1 Tax=Sphingomonas vulcanisoli TaxID=1658060 RepID=A0ABX0TNY1_9SPHN|nr:DNA circularization N-terminal domain-containing protein [Sphingomonas vulcanisoli]NIJ07243.1 prophage DNA circulation protein [Sphingomonas vulcanisoli]